MSKMVMIIDDSVTVRKIVEVSLRREGIEYVSYSNGIEAVRALTEQKSLVPDLVFLDISLPRMDGYQFAQYLKSHTKYDNTVIVMHYGQIGVHERLYVRHSVAMKFKSI